MAMQKLFIYGTLKNKEVGEELFGGEARGTHDALEGFAKTVTEIEGVAYPNIVPKDGDTVSGEVIEVTEDMLARADAYETNAYDRRMMMLRSGTRAWTYIRVVP